MGAGGWGVCLGADVEQLYLNQAGLEIKNNQIKCLKVEYVLSGYNRFLDDR